MVSCRELTAENLGVCIDIDVRCFKEKAVKDLFAVNFCFSPSSRDLLFFLKKYITC